MAAKKAKVASADEKVGQSTVVYYFGLTFLKVELSCAVQLIDARQLVPAAEDKLKWEAFLDSVDNDLHLYSTLRQAVKKDSVKLEPHFECIPMLGDRKMTYIYRHDKTMSFSDVDKTKLWKTCLSENEYREVSEEYKEDDRCDMLIPYFRLNPSIPKEHPFLSSNVGWKQRRARYLKEEGWTHRLEWCLNKLYDQEFAFAMCFGDDWMQVGRYDLDKELCWHPFSGTPDILAGSSRTSETLVMVAKVTTEDLIECKESNSGGQGQLYAAMLLTAGTAILTRLVNQQDDGDIETVTVRGLLINRKYDCSICHLEVKPFGKDYPKWSHCFIVDGALNEMNLLWTLNELWKLPTEADHA
ncbi:uncharacterized protein LOC134179818 [Corticium candelabrum]|uniref:uncharacterized protein LOC134179818 n=1 Tax=Corticium candelabrum TaxID=121492 RepID=UPI002E261C1F|nr:uncharacterized protein LOC134179818 [Corticium candelabrum]XP_062502772.1 uncharacterized protein LOC134179818 [Corticium candelabrum]